MNDFDNFGGLVSNGIFIDDVLTLGLKSSPKVEKKQSFFMNDSTIYRLRAYNVKALT